MLYWNKANPLTPMGAAGRATAERSAVARIDATTEAIALESEVPANVQRQLRPQRMPEPLVHPQLHAGVDPSTGSG